MCSRFATKDVAPFDGFLGAGADDVEGVEFVHKGSSGLTRWPAQSGISVEGYASVLRRLHQVIHCPFYCAPNA